MKIFPRSVPLRATLSAGAAPFVCRSCRRSSHRKLSSASARRREADSGPPAPPPTGYARLTSRRLISIAGPDAPKFLQGLITQSIIPGGSRTHRGQGRDGASGATPAATTAASGFYCAFLNAMGRVLYDVFVYRDILGLGTAAGSDGEAFVVEVDAAQADALAKHIKRYKLRSKFSCRVIDEEECAAWQVWEDSPSPSFSSSPHPQQILDPPRLAQLQGCIVLPDARAPGMGYRVLARAPSLEPLLLPALGGQPPAGGLARADDDAYRLRRYLRGVAEGQNEIPREHALPLEANMDVSGGIDFRKGCYVGQELTIRTRHRGVVRKRILPCLLYAPASSPSATTATTAAPPQNLEYRPYIEGRAGAGHDEGEGTRLTAADVPPLLSIGRSGATRNRSAGTWLRGVGNVGLALCRLQVMTDVELPGETTTGAPFDPVADEFFVLWGGEGEGKQQSVKIRAFVPDWLRGRLREDGAGAH
ncbi:Aminomethyltransferase folate-binding domain-containing protein [Durotheca rogersii]|uniref:Aminomethyltransferase folate-binding domain-containing protein n=1 Tax=Durotheca rogersii TaxID=419775 RepID=UPI00221ECED1|nr:Aminomethyltransferase folate-binding domain-containing protein [Durotheca rogersii]KAI5862295.1 Aminomethyltransferase folate-binding domain-containing protein [Durotheca rogersii]